MCSPNAESVDQKEKFQYPKEKLRVEHGSLHKSSIGSSLEIQPSSKYHFYQYKTERKRLA